MTIDTGEELLAAALGDDNPLAQAARSLDPFIVPYDQLARLDGWVVWLGHPPVPDGLHLLPAPEHLLWDEPLTTLATAAAVAADYAARRGATDPGRMRSLLERESPVTLVVPNQLTAPVKSLADHVATMGVPLVANPADVDAGIARTVPFAMRRRAHAKFVGRSNDPALSFQEFSTTNQIGGDPLSSFVLHGEGERDGVEIYGDFGDHVAIEIGVRGPDLTPQTIAWLESQAAEIPSFLNGVSSRRTGDALEIGWRQDAKPTGEEIGQVFQVWLKALYDLDLVDVKIAFAAGKRSSALLSTMSERARRYRTIRAGTIAGNANPAGLLDDDEPT